MNERSSSWPWPSFTTLLVVTVSLGCCAVLMGLTLRGSDDLLIIALAPIGLAVGVVAVRQPQLVILLLAGLLVAESLATVKGISLYKAMTPVVFAGIAVQYTLKRLEPIGLDLMDGLVLVWLIYNAALIPSSMDSGTAADEVKRTFNVALFYVMVSRLFVEEKWRDRLVLSIIGISVGLVSYGLVTFYGGGGVTTDTGVHRFSIASSGTTSDDFERLVEPNLLAAYLFFPLFLLVSRIQHMRSLAARIVAIGSSCALIAGILLTYSRSAFVVLVVGLVLFALRSRIQPRHVVGLGILGVLALPLIPPSYWDRIATLIEGESAAAGSLVVRASLIEVGERIVRENPVFGIGPGNFLQASAMSQFQDQSHLLGKGYVAHNLFLETIAETGIVGFVLFMSLITMALYRMRILAIRQPRDALLMALELTFVTFLLSSLFQSTGTKKVLWLMLGLVRVLSDPIVRNEVEAREARQAESTADDGVIDVAAQRIR